MSNAPICQMPLSVRWPYMSDAPICQKPLHVTCPYLSETPICQTPLFVGFPLFVICPYMSDAHICRTPLYVGFPYLSDAPICQMPLFVRCPYLSDAPICQTPLFVRRPYSWFSHDVTKIRTTKLLISLRFYFNDVQEQLKTNIHTKFRSEWALGFVIQYAWISKLLRDASFTWRPRELSAWLKKWLISGNLAIWTVHVLGKVLFWCFRVIRGINPRFCSKTQWQMFLLVSAMLVPIRMGTSMASPYKSL